MLISLPMVLALLTIPQAPTDGSNPPRVVISPEEIVSALETTIVEAIAKAEPSVVAIDRTKSATEETKAIRGRMAPPSEPNPRFFQNFEILIAPEYLSFDYGSGVVIGDKGEILTAYHVVKGAERLRVRAVDTPMFDAEIIAADPRSDLAVIAPRENPGGRPPKLKPMAIGDSSKLRKGAFLLALGNPFNAAHDGRPSASWGILSNVARRLEATQDEKERNELQLRHYPTLLQLDSKLNLGMSGGAVINLKGELVGLTTAAGNASGFDALAGYAIPMDSLGRNVVKALKDGREYEYGFLGIGFESAPPTNRVRTAAAGSPAANAGVLVEDQIVGVGDVPIHDSESLIVAVNAIPTGEPVLLKIVRGNRPIERTVVLAKRPVVGEIIATNRPEPWRGIRVDFTTILANKILGDEHKAALAKQQGVVVTDVAPGSGAAKAGLKVGQIIARVGETAVSNPKEFLKSVDGLKGPVQIETENGPLTID